MSVDQMTDTSSSGRQRRFGEHHGSQPQHPCLPQPARTNGAVLLRDSRQSHLQLGMVIGMTNTIVFGLGRQDRQHAEGRQMEHELFKDGDEKVIGISVPQDLVQDYPSYDEAFYNTPAALSGSRRGVSRHLHVGFLDQAVSVWGERAARRSVKKLGLELVEASQYGTDLWKPSLVHFQGLGVDHMYDDWFSSMQMEWADRTGVSNNPSVGGNE